MAVNVWSRISMLVSMEEIIFFFPIKICHGTDSNELMWDACIVYQLHPMMGRLNYALFNDLIDL